MSTAVATNGIKKYPQSVLEAHRFVHELAGRLSQIVLDAVGGSPLTDGGLRTLDKIVEDHMVKNWIKYNPIGFYYMLQGTIFRPHDFERYPLLDPVWLVDKRTFFDQTEKFPERDVQQDDKDEWRAYMYLRSKLPWMLHGNIATLFMKPEVLYAITRAGNYLPSAEHRAPQLIQLAEKEARYKVRAQAIGEDRNWADKYLPADEKPTPGALLEDLPEGGISEDEIENFDWLSRAE